MSDKTKGLTAAALLGIVCFGVGTTIVGPLLSVIAGTYDFPIRYSGIIFSSNFLGFILFNIVFAIFFTHIDLRKLLVSILFVYTACLTLFTQVHSFFAVLILIFLIGGLGGLIESTCSVLLAVVNKGREGYFLNLGQVFFGIGAIVGPMGSGIMEELGLPWQYMFALVALLSLFSAFIFLIFKVPVKGSLVKFGYSDIARLMKNVKFLILMICMMLYIGAEIGAWGWVATLLKNVYTVSAFKASFAVSLFWGFMTLGRMITAKMTERLTYKRILLILSGGGSISTLILALSTNEIFVWIMIPFIGIFYSGVWPIIVALSGKITGEYSAPAAYLVIAAGAFGGMIFPYIIGFFSKGDSIMIALGIITVMSAAIFILIKAFIKNDI